MHGERRTKIDGDDHRIVGQTSHEKYGRAQLVEAGAEIHHKAGMKVVIDAGAEITLKAGGSFLKLDPSGVTIVGAAVKINSGGSPGSGSGQNALEPLLAEHAATESHTIVAPIRHQAQLKTLLKAPVSCEICDTPGGEGSA
nr:hypothetical protein [uncultured Halomonas sp.]